jgi:hypothetical protein
MLDGRRRQVLVAACLLVAGSAFVAAVFLRLDRAVTSAASPDRLRDSRVRPLSFRPFSPRKDGTEVVGDGTAAGAVTVDGSLFLAGGSGLALGERTLDTTDGLPFLRACAAASWRGTPVFALERSGWGRLTAHGPEEATSGWDPLEVRTLVETESGELLVGARQGLFRAAFASNELERLDGEPVRALAVLPGGSIASGGETGLRIVSGSGAPPVAVASHDPWINSVATDGRNLWLATQVGVSVGSLSQGTVVVSAHARGGDAVSGVLVSGSFRALPQDGGPRVAGLGAEGSRFEEPTPERFRQLFAAAGTPEELFADGPSGVWRRDPAKGWTLVRPRPEATLPRPHVNALTSENGTLWAGFFDGGIAFSRPDGKHPAPWTEIQGSGAWGVNALLPAGGAVYAATLRGAFRIENRKAIPVEGVGTPSGLGSIVNARVVTRTVFGDGSLPHPWVTAILDLGASVLVGTYGGGVARRTADGGHERFERFVETDGLKVNSGAMLVDALGRVWVGTQGHGVWRSDREKTRFTQVPLALPSPDVFSLALHSGTASTALYVGTSEGLARIPVGEETDPEAR